MPVAQGRCTALALCVASAREAVAAVRLTGRDPVALGHVQLHGERRLELRTASVDPPVFLIPNFLDAREADELIAQAQSQKDWEGSSVRIGDREEVKQLRKGGRAAKQALQQFDRDSDGLLELGEMQEVSLELFALPNYDATAHQAMLRHASHVLGTEKVPVDIDDLPLKHAGKADLYNFFSDLAKNEPQRRLRYSDQVWLRRDARDGSLVKEITARAQAVTGFPDEVMNTEDMQVVRYGRQGHYACHHDSSPDSIDEGDTRLATLGIFLNDPEDGGETVFPGALRNDTADWGEDEWSILEKQCQPTAACNRLGGLVVQPRKGDAVFWYNVRPEYFQGLAAGEAVPGSEALIWGSVHCAAEVLAGEKWFANLWMRLRPRSASLGRPGDEL